MIEIKRRWTKDRLILSPVAKEESGKPANARTLIPNAT